MESDSPLSGCQTGKDLAQRAEYCAEFCVKEPYEPALCNRHDYGQIIKHLSTMLDADPDNALLHYGLYEGYAEKGMYKEAIQQL